MIYKQRAKRREQGRWWVTIFQTLLSSHFTSISIHFVHFHFRLLPFNTDGLENRNVLGNPTLSHHLPRCINQCSVSWLPSHRLLPYDINANSYHLNHELVAIYWWHLYHREAACGKVTKSSPSRCWSEACFLFQSTLHFVHRYWNSCATKGGTEKPTPRGGRK